MHLGEVGLRSPAATTSAGASAVGFGRRLADELLVQEPRDLGPAQQRLPQLDLVGPGRAEEDRSGRGSTPSGRPAASAGRWRRPPARPRGGPGRRSRPGSRAPCPARLRRMPVHSCFFPSYSSLPATLVSSRAAGDLDLARLVQEHVRPRPAGTGPTATASRSAGRTSAACPASAGSLKLGPLGVEDFRQVGVERVALEEPLLGGLPSFAVVSSWSATLARPRRRRGGGTPRGPGSTRATKNRRRRTSATSSLSTGWMPLLPLAAEDREQFQRDLLAQRVALSRLARQQRRDDGAAVDLGRPPGSGTGRSSPGGCARPGRARPSRGRTSGLRRSGSTSRGPASCGMRQQFDEQVSAGGVSRSASSPSAWSSRSPSAPAIWNARMLQGFLSHRLARRPRDLHPLLDVELVERTGRRPALRGGVMPMCWTNSWTAGRSGSAFGSSDQVQSVISVCVLPPP